MSQAEKSFDRIANKLVNESPAISLGKMMASPGIKYRNKVFAFYHGDEMVFRLGKGFDPARLGVRRYAFLQPFKNKAPMTGWFQVPYEEAVRWETLARTAMNVMAEELGA